jgi:VanZ family protein
LRQPSPRTWALLAVGWALLTWLLLTAGQVPGEALVAPWVPPALRPWQDKVAHAAIFLVQALLVERAVTPRLGGSRALLLSLAFCALFGLLTELWQRELPGRDADAGDFAADVAGAVAYAIALPLSRRRERARAAA